MRRFDPISEGCFLERGLKPAATEPEVFSSHVVVGFSPRSRRWPCTCFAPAEQYVTPTTRDTEKEALSSDDLLREPLDSLSIELSRISAEIQSINSGFQSQMQQMVALVRDSIENEYRVRMERALNEVREQTRQETEQELRKDFEAELHARIEHLGDVQTEIERVRTQSDGVTKEIAAMLDDPSVELSRVMRKRTEQAELKAYLEGLRFSIEQGKAKETGT